jgi:predicted transcriptional regulator
MTHEIEKNAIMRMMEDLFCKDNLIILIIAAGRVEEISEHGVNVIDDDYDMKDEEIVDALISLGMKKPAARMLSYIQQGNEASSIELEMETDLRQPEVSIAAKQLKERDWINEREENILERGRPFKIYSLKVGFKDIIAQLEKQQRKAVDETQDKIKRLMRHRIR